jgi:hypothetical protein
VFAIQPDYPGGSLCLVGFLIGVMVGLTSMGGAALMTPFLILIVGIRPILAVGTDFVFGKARMRGRLEFVLILPDGSKSLIPADWTDFKSASGAPQAPVLVGSLDDLLPLRDLVDALLRRTAELPVRSGQPTAKRLARFPFCVQTGNSNPDEWKQSVTVDEALEIIRECAGVH